MRRRSQPVDFHAASRRQAPERIEPAQQLDRLGAQLGVERAPVLARELAGAVVELGLADLAAAWPPSPPPARPARPTPGRSASAPRGRRSGPTITSTATASTASTSRTSIGRPAGALRRGRAPAPAAPRRPPVTRRRDAAPARGQSAISPPAKTISAPSQIQVTSGETSTRKLAGGRSVAVAARPAGAAPRRAPPARSASGSELARSNTASPRRTIASSVAMSGATTVQKSRRSPARSPTSLVASPSK